MNSEVKIGKNLKKARLNMEYTQHDVAEKVGIHVNYYAKIERGEVRPSLDTFEEILKTLKVKSSDVLPF